MPPQNEALILNLVYHDEQTRVITVDVHIVIK